MTEPVEAATTQTAPVKPEPASKQQRSRFSLLLISFNLLLLAGMAGLGYVYWKQQASLATLTADSASLEQRSSEAQARFAAAADTSAQLQEALQAQNALVAEQFATQAKQLDATNRELISLRLRISDQGSGANQGWMLTEAESLLRLARQRLLSARDVRSAISLYLACDDLLRQLNDPAVVAVREILTTELDTLRSVNIPDMTRMYEQLGNISLQLDELSLVAAANENTLKFNADSSETITETDSWLDSLGASLGQYFIIKRQDSPVLPQLSPEQAYMSRQIIRLHLEQARAALLREDTRLYQAALAAAHDDIEQYLQGANKAQLLAAVVQLRDTPILAAIPATGSALNALRQIAPPVSTGNEGQGQ